MLFRSGRGLSNEEEPDLWRRDYTGDIEQWIDLGQPDESRIRKACGRAHQVVVVTYSGNAAELWWTRIAPSLTRLKNLSVIDISSDVVAQVTSLLQRGMRLTAMIQDGELQLMSDSTNIVLTPRVRMAPSA